MGFGQQPGFGPQGGFAPQAGFARRQGQGSVSKANTNTYERQVDLGNNLEYTQGLSNSRAVTRQNGQRVVSDSQARTRDVDLGGLQIGNTLTRTRTNANGAVSGGIADQFRVGNVGLGASLSPDNLRQGFGLQRGADGDLRLGLGLLSFDLDNNVQNNNQLSQASVNAQGRGAQAGSNSRTNTNTQQIGGFNVRDTVTNSNAYGRTRNGQTSAQAGGFGGNAVSQGSPFGGFGFQRRRRAPAPAQQLVYRQPVAVAAAPNRRLVRPKRRAQFVPFGYPQPQLQPQPQPGFGGYDGFNFFERPRRQFGGGFGGFGGGGFGGFGGGGYGGPGGFGGGGWGDPYAQPQAQPQPQPGFQQQGHKKRRPGQVQSTGNAGAHGGPGFNQQAASNNFAHQNADGSQNSGSSSIGSNLAADGSSGQVSSANTNHQSSANQQTNDAQSQALNFRPGEQQASSSNAHTEHTRDGNRETIGSNSGSTSTNNNQFGSATNTANTDTKVVRDGDQESINSDANSQSIFQGNQGQGNSAANTNANVSSQRGPNGSVTNSASSSATATAQNGQSANADANAAAGGFGDGAGADANANGGGFGGGGGANSNSNAFGGFNPEFGFGFGR